VSDLGHTANIFSFFLFSHSYLPCATVLGTRQTCKFRRVPEPGHTAKTPPRCMLWRDQAATLAHARCGGRRGKAESRHIIWRDLVAPYSVARLSRF